MNNSVDASTSPAQQLCPGETFAASAVHRERLGEELGTFAELTCTTWAKTQAGVDMIMAGIEDCINSEVMQRE